MRVLFYGVALAGGLLAAEDAAGAGRKIEQQSCIQCHGLRLVHSQRLSRQAWNREIDKMIRWGAVVRDREALLEYLTTNFGDDKPVPAPELSADGSGRK